MSAVTGAAPSPGKRGPFSSPRSWPAPPGRDPGAHGDGGGAQAPESLRAPFGTPASQSSNFITSSKLSEPQLSYFIIYIYGVSNDT